MWAMDDVAWKMCDQYLVFNIIVHIIDGKEIKEGMMIKISDGMLIHFKGILCVTELQFVEIQSQESCVIQETYMGFILACLNANSYFIVPYLHIREMLITPKMIVCQCNNKKPKQFRSITL